MAGQIEARLVNPEESALNCSLSLGFWSYLLPSFLWSCILPFLHYILFLSFLLPLFFIFALHSSLFSHVLAAFLIPSWLHPSFLSCLPTSLYLFNFLLPVLSSLLLPFYSPLPYIVSFTIFKCSFTFLKKCAKVLVFNNEWTGRELPIELKLLLSDGNKFQVFTLLKGKITMETEENKGCLQKNRWKQRILW